MSLDFCLVGLCCELECELNLDAKEGGNKRQRLRSVCEVSTENIKKINFSHSDLDNGGKDGILRPQAPDL